MGPARASDPPATNLRPFEYQRKDSSELTSSAVVFFGNLWRNILLWKPVMAEDGGNLQCVPSAVVIVM